MFFLSLCLFAALSPAAAQTFQIRVEQSGQAFGVQNGGIISFPSSAVGVPVEARIDATYLGSSILTITSVLLVGSGEFLIKQRPERDSEILPNGRFQMVVEFMPRTANELRAQIVIGTSERPLTPPPGTVTQPALGTVTLNLIGTAPSYAFGYILPSDNNFVRTNAGAAILFPPVLASSVSTAVFAVVNRGSGAGTLESLQLTGSPDFQLQGVPLLPATLAPGGELRVNLRFNPKNAGTSTGQLEATVDGVPTRFRVEGTADRVQISYELIDNGTVTLIANGAVTLPDQPLNETGIATLRVRNSGAIDTVVTSLNISGNGFQLLDPPPLPFNLPAGNSLVLTIGYTATQPGRLSGRLRVNGDSLELVSGAAGSRLVLQYSRDTSPPISLPMNGTVAFHTVPVGETARALVRLSNTGTAAATVGNISVPGGSGAFLIGQSPALPLTLNPGDTSEFTVMFRPTQSGPVNASLSVDAMAFALTGNGSPPPPLPGYRIEGPATVMEPRRQPPVRLSLNSPYPLRIQGALILSFHSENFGNDPAVQFSTGSRRVEFTILPGETQATFSNNLPEVRFQTGTVAGTITLTPEFQTASGGFNLTPDRPAQATITIAAQAPQLLDVQVSQRSDVGLTLVITGFATTRSLSQLEFVFTPAVSSGLRLENPTQTFEIQPAADLWYASAASLPFGSLFTATVPFGLQNATPGAVSNGNGNLAALLSVLESVTVRARNTQGDSNPVTLRLR